MPDVIIGEHEMDSYCFGWKNTIHLVHVGFVE
jgi:hypothetical protein